MVPHSLAIFSHVELPCRVAGDEAFNNLRRLEISVQTEAQLRQGDKQIGSQQMDPGQIGMESHGFLEERIYNPWKGWELWGRGVCYPNMIH